MQEYRISSNSDDFDLAIIHQFISQSYWAKDIPIATLEKAILNSMCFAVISKQDDTEQLVGFARMITDRATFAYLADVFILIEHRGKELSKRLMQAVVSHPELQGLRRMLLATRDAHGLYQQFGFKKLATPDIFMELWNPEVYSS